MALVSHRWLNIFHHLTVYNIYHPTLHARLMQFRLTKHFLGLENKNILSSLQSPRWMTASGIWLSPPQGALLGIITVKSTATSVVQVLDCQQRSLNQTQEDCHWLQTKSQLRLTDPLRSPLFCPLNPPTPQLSSCNTAPSSRCQTIIKCADYLELGIKGCITFVFFSFFNYLLSPLVCSSYVSSYLSLVPLSH